MKRGLKMFLFVAAVSMGGSFAAADARAASCSAAEASEMVRLRSELSKLVGKNAHSGAVSTFEKMLDLAKQKCEIKPDDYKLAATSARNLGDIEKAITWFNGGGGSSDAADLKARFGQVKISEKAGELLKDGGLPFPPDERAALEAAAKAVKSSGKYDGYLPIGTYKLGAKSFEVKTTGVTKV